MKRLQRFAALLSATLALTTGANAAAPKVFRYQFKVVDTNGLPVAGAIVERYRGPEGVVGSDISSQLEESRTTDATGTVTFTTTNRAPLMVVARKPGLSLGWTLANLMRSSEDTAVELTLTAPLAVSGVVRDAAGKPIAEAAVWASVTFRPARREGISQSWSLLYSQLGRQYLATRSVADGTFRIGGLPTDATLELAATKPGLALDQPSHAYLNPSTLSFHAGQTDIVLTLNRAGVVVGSVVQEEAGTPVAAARVLLGDTWLSADSLNSTTAGPDGKFVVSDLCAGEHTLRAFVGTNQFAEWVCESASVTVEAGATNRDVKLIASRGGVLELTVRDEAGDQPIADASVTVSRAQLNQAARTSDQGVARLRLVPGDYSVSILAEGYSGNALQVTLERGETNRQSVTLTKAASLSGTVVDANGKPAAKIAVMMLPAGRGDTKQTDAQGRFTLTPNVLRFGGPADVQRVIIARDLARNLAAALEVEEDTTNANLRLGPALILVGRVTDPDGKAITIAQAQALFWTERMGSSLGLPVAVDGQGRFEINGLPPGRRYGVNVSAKGYGRGSRTLEAQDTDQRRLELEPFQLPVADRRIAGVVLDAEDKPVAGATVLGSGQEQPMLNGRTDAKGRFAFEQVCAGPIHLSANDPRNRSYGNVSAEGGDTNITIQLGASQNVRMLTPSRGGSKLTGSVLDPEGKPASKATVSLFPFYQAQRQTDAEGRFTLTWDPNQFRGPGMNERVVVARDLARNLAAALDLEEDMTNVTLRLEPALAVRGRVTDATGKAITNAQAQVLLRADRMTSLLGSPGGVDAEGRFEVRGLPPGRHYTVNASAKGYGQENQQLDAAERDTRSVELDPFELPLADQRIAGVVVDADDKAMAGVMVYAHGNKQPSLSGSTDAKGRFSFDKVCAGPISLSANSPRGRFGSATAEGGDTNITIRMEALARVRGAAPRPTSLKGKPVPDLTALGFTPAEIPADQPLLALLIDAEQRPSRRALRLLGEQAALLKQKGVALVVLQAGSMTDEAFAAWKQEAGSPFPIGCLKGDPDKARAAWGAGALPWLVLADKTHHVIAEGFSPEEVEAQVGELGR